MELQLTTDGLRIAEVRRQIIDYLRAAGSHDADYEAAELIVGELLANVVRHAPGPFSLSVGFKDGYARFEIRDHGSGFSLPEGDADPLHQRGRGLRLVQRLAHEVSARHVAHQGTTVSVRLPVAEKRTAGC